MTNDYLSSDVERCEWNLSSNSTVNKDNCCKTHLNSSCWLAVFSNTSLKALQSTHVKVNRLLLWTFLKLITIPLGALFYSAIVCLHYLKPISVFSWLWRSVFCQNELLLETYNSKHYQYWLFVLNWSLKGSTNWNGHVWIVQWDEKVW